MVGRLKCIDSLQLKILAMALMLCDHIWASLVPGNRWLTDIGRMAFPIFAFQLAQGYLNTQNYKNYLGRLFIFALISEIPFNLMYSGSVFFPFHQNVLFTFCISLIVIRIIDRAGKKDRCRFIFICAAALILGFMAASVLMCDYFGFGVLTVLLFYFCHDRKYGWLYELAGLVLINFFMLSGMDIPFKIFGHEFFIPQQGFAAAALIPIWMYNGKKGKADKRIRFLFYLFYPLHMLLLWMAGRYIIP